MTEYTTRQIRNLELSLSEYEQKRISLNHLVQNLMTLSNLLDEIESKYVEKLKEVTNDLELINAMQLYRDEEKGNIRVEEGIETKKLLKAIKKIIASARKSI